MKMTRFLAATALAGAALITPALAAAQSTTGQGETESSEQTGNALNTQPGDSNVASDNALIVTGTRIRTPNLTSTAPVTSVSAVELQSTARISIGDTLNNLPQLQSTFSQANSTRFLGTAGLNLLDLYGLGSSRTLVLQNGRRHVASDILNNAVSVDVNTIPTDLVDRVDIVTGGNSSVYGSDAIAGVVNFVLKDNFEGLQARTQGSISQYGDAGSYFGSITAGKNFSEGRGNIAINGEYARQNSLYGSQRKRLRQNDTFVTVDTDQPQLGTTQPNISINNDGNPDAVFFRDNRSATINQYGLVALAAPNGACGRDKDGRYFTCNYVFDALGNLSNQTGTRVGLGNSNGTPSGSFIGGNGDSRRDGQLLQILPQNERYAANLIGHYEVSDAFVPFIEAKYVRVNTFGQGGSGPAFYTGSTIDASRERPRLDNPFLSAQARATLSTQLLDVVNQGFNPASGAALTAAQQATLRTQIADGSYRFILRKNLVDLGIRSEKSVRETYRFVGGVKGDFNEDWHYELSGNYGEFKERTTVLGNVNVQRELLALDAVRNAAGQIVCASQVPGNTASAANAQGWNGDPLNLIGNDVAACVPLNPFGAGSTQAVRDYILQNTVSRGKITQLDVLGFVSGDLSQLFELPGGPIAFSVGGEYRRETNYYAQDPLVENGYTFYNAIGVFDPPSFEVKEAFGELSVPLLKDLPFARELTLEASGRVSDYKGSAGTVYTYNLGGTYAPVQDIIFRGSYARAVRAPNLSELFSPNSQNFAPGFADPCSARNLASGTQFRAANCAAAGIPTSYDYQYAQSLEIVSGGNPALDVEKSDSYTAGVVLQPTFAPGFSLSVDYYDIKVKNVITSVSAQNIANQCYDSPTLDNPFCSLFSRVGATGTGPGGEQPFRIIEGSLLQSTLNFASLKARGINTTLNYARSFGDVKVNANLTYTHQLERANFTNPIQPDFGDNLRGEVGSPKDAANLNLTADLGTFFTNWQFRYLSGMSVGAIENHEDYQDRAAQNLDDYDIPFYPEVFYIDARFGLNVSDAGSQFYFGIDNLTNRYPPLGATGIGAGSAIYEPVGRRFYAGFTAKF